MDETDTFRPTIRTQAELERAWRHLMSPLGWAEPALWLMVIGPDDTPVPHLQEITDFPGRPTAEDLEQLGEFLAMVRDVFEVPEARFAFLRARPGMDDVGPDDVAWARGLLAACRSQGIDCAPVHLATDVDIRPVPLDAAAA